ncbi:MAG: putative Mn2+ efflux pump MntP [Glaciecola sp.]|jgi:putative Mn2+ efflux pump MntP
MLEVILLSVALSMDVFAVSIGIGVNKSRIYKYSSEAENRFSSAFIIAIYFAVFHAVFPLLGYLGGVTLFAWFESLSQWIGFTILVSLGLKAIYDSFQKDGDEIAPSLTHNTLLIIAIATSIDAFAAGFTLALIPFSPYLSCLIIGLTTLVVSLFGFFLGSIRGERITLKAELFGGFILIAIGFKILLF